MLIDSHCHLDFDVFNADRPAILARCEQLNITRIIVPAVTASRWDNLLAITQTSPKLYHALGLHPMFMAQHKPKDINLLNDYIDRFNPVAIGEIGLDFYLEGHDQTTQITLFEQQLEVAVSSNLPVILHVRKAHDLVIQLLKKHRVRGGIVHAFSGSEHQAELYINLGFLLGVGGTITYDKATRLRSMFSKLPLSALALETDAPDMPLQGQKNHPNSPESIAIIVSVLSTLRSESKAMISMVTSDSVNRLFNLQTVCN